MKNYLNMKYFSKFKKVLIYTFSLLIFLYAKVSLKIFDSFQSIEFDNGVLINVKDNHNKSLIISTSKNVYTNLIPNLTGIANETIYEINSAVTCNQNYAIISCLRSSLIAKMNLQNGEIIPIDFIYKMGQLAFKSCSISIINDTVYIHFPIKSGNKMHINIFEIGFRDLNNTEDGPKSMSKIIGGGFGGIEPISYTQQIECENLSLLDENNIYLVCIYVNPQLENNETIYNIYGVVNYVHYYIFNTNIIETNIRIEKLDSFTLKCIAIDRNINIKLGKNETNIYIFNSSDIFYKNNLISYSNDYIFTSSGNDLKIEKTNSLLLF